MKCDSAMASDAESSAIVFEVALSLAIDHFRRYEALIDAEYYCNDADSLGKFIVNMPFSIGKNL
ncbi:MAG: hypothetical protein HY445_00780 [Candidatus Niyogibacteria bacterium]|nr:hypothetical protein [Candidatus Niyogibacteria bacterium]